MNWDSPQARANFLRTEYDTRHPKFRLTVLGYLLDKLDPTTDEFMDIWQKCIDFIGADLESFITDIESQTSDEMDGSSNEPTLANPDSGAYI